MSPLQKLLVETLAETRREVISGITEVDNKHLTVVILAALMYLVENTPDRMP